MVGAPWLLSSTYCAFLCRRFFWFGTFERSKPLGVYFSTYCAFCAKGFFGSDRLKCRSPLAFILALIVPFVPMVFWFGPFERSKPLGFCFDKYAKFADSAYFANLQFTEHTDAGRSLPFRLLR